MSHSITAIVLKGDFDRNQAIEFDLHPVDLGFGLSLFHIDHYYSACWQYKLKTEGELKLSNIDCIVFPREVAISEIVQRIANSVHPKYAIILTDYFGGIGSQFANVFVNSDNADKSISTINQALKYLGVTAIEGRDEFDTVGLGHIRNQPEFLEKYIELSTEYGV